MLINYVNAIRKRSHATTVALAVGAALVAGASPSWAGSATANLSITATVSANCLLTTTPVAFGAYDPVATNAAAGADLTATGTVVGTCTKNSTPVTITLGLGSHPDGLTRRMAHGTTGEALTYELYQPSTATPGAACALSQVWGTTGGAVFTPDTGWGATTAKTFNVCGKVPKAQDVATGSYSDVVLATITF